MDKQIRPENLRELRTKLGLTQIEMAKLIGVSAEAWRNWEWGAHKPSPKNIQKLIELAKAQKHTAREEG
jgi:DNA-binding transcriptional regulator YiaG